MKHRRQLRYSSVLAVFLIIGLLLTACGGNNQAKQTYTVGIVNILPVLDNLVTSFQAGMTELGYVEGQNVTYVHREVTAPNELEQVLQDMVAADVDLILSTTTVSTRAAQQATANTDIPIVFTPLIDPVGAGLVNSIKQPGGNSTGLVFGVPEARRLQWLVQIVPGVEQIYIPYNPENPASVADMEAISKAAAELGVNLITREVRNAEEVEAAITNIPGEADAVFALAVDGLISTRSLDLVNAALEHKLPSSSANADSVKDGTMIGFGPSDSSSGKQTARVASQILKGIKPADLPLETAEIFLAINLKTAADIGLEIPDDILRQADTIIR